MKAITTITTSSTITMLHRIISTPLFRAGLCSKRFPWICLRPYNYNSHRGRHYLGGALPWLFQQQHRRRSSTIIRSMMTTSTESMPSSYQNNNNKNNNIDINNTDSISTSNTVISFEAQPMDGYYESPTPLFFISGEGLPTSM